MHLPTVTCARQCDQEENYCISFVGYRPRCMVVQHAQIQEDVQFRRTPTLIFKFRNYFSMSKLVGAARGSTVKLKIQTIPSYEVRFY